MGIFHDVRTDRLIKALKMRWLGYELDAAIWTKLTFIGVIDVEEHGTTEPGVR